jgi:hypothetical protein
MVKTMGSFAANNDLQSGQNAALAALAALAARLTPSRWKIDRAKRC